MQRELGFKISFILILFVIILANFANNITAQTPSFQGLGHIPGGSFPSQPYGISGDGTVVVGPCSMRVVIL